MQLLIEHLGEELEVCVDDRNLQLNGRAASHTGFRSEWLEQRPGEETIRRRCEAAIAEFLTLPYLVGRVDCDLWNYVGKSWRTERLQIRIPQWHTGEVLAELQRQGFLFTDELNHYLDAPAELTRVQLQDLLQPLLAEGSRAIPETELASRLAAAARGKQQGQLRLF